MKKTSLFFIIALFMAVSALIWHRAQQPPTFATQNTNTVIIGINSEFPPFTFKENDEFVGFDIDVIQEVFKRLNTEITYKDMPFDALIPEIQIGKIQVIAGGMTPTEERAQRAFFTHPHLTGDPLVIISLKNGNPLTSLDDLRGKTVAVNEGYTADSFMSEQPGIQLLRLSSAQVSDGMLVLENGRVNAFVAASLSMKPYFTKYDSNNFNVTPIPNTEESSAFAVSKHYPDLRRDIQVMLNEMEEDGTLAALKTKWNLL